MISRIVKDLRMEGNKPPRIKENIGELSARLRHDEKDKLFEEKKKFGAHLDVITTLAAFEVN
jgi:hypothetical protein